MLDDDFDHAMFGLPGHAGVAVRAGCAVRVRMDLPRDTSPAHAAQVAAWRRMGPSRRLALAIRMSEDIRELALSGIRHRHPEYSEAEARWALFRLVLGDELFVRAYPRAPVLAP